MKYLYFTAAWCGPCRQLGPIMEQVSQEGIPIQKIDVDNETELTAEYGIRNVPTVILVDGDKELSRTVGVNPKDHYIQGYKKFN